MEEASFAIMSRASVYQVSRPDLYYVNHLSEYEHRMRSKTHNVNISITKSAIMSAAAIAHECSTIEYVTDNSIQYLSILPFYGGLPPNTSANLKVNSIGEGNSIVNRTVKTWQCMATVCSLLKYYNHVVIGVASGLDEEIIRHNVSNFNKRFPLFIYVSLAY